MWQTMEVLVAVVGLWLLVQFLILPLARQEMRRRASRAHTPQAEELWIQDKTLLYIDAVGPTGVEIIQYDAANNVTNRWKDTWPEWHTRLKNRVVWFTGERRPLGNA